MEIVHGGGLQVVYDGRGDGGVLCLVQVKLPIPGVGVVNVIAANDSISHQESGRLPGQNDGRLVHSGAIQVQRMRGVYNKNSPLASITQGNLVYVYMYFLFVVAYVPIYKKSQTFYQFLSITTINKPFLLFFRYNYQSKRMKSPFS